MQAKASRLILNKDGQKGMGSTHVFPFPLETGKSRQRGRDSADGFANLQSAQYSGDNKVQSDGDGKVRIYTNRQRMDEPA